MIQLQVVKACMRSLANGAARGDLDSVNIAPQDMRLVSGDIPWVGNQRTLVVRVLESLIFSSLDTMGIQRYNIPAEYVAATIAMFVHPSNIMVACVWMESGKESADAMGNPTSASINREEVNSQQLFAIVCEALQDGKEIAGYKHQFESRNDVSYLSDFNKQIGDQYAEDAQEPSSKKHQKQR